MKDLGFLALDFFFFLFLVIKIGKMSEFSVNRILGNFKIVKGMFLRGYSCQVFEINSRKI